MQSLLHIWIGKQCEPYYLANISTVTVCCLELVVFSIQQYNMLDSPRANEVLTNTSGYFALSQQNIIWISKTSKWVFAICRFVRYKWTGDYDFERFWKYPFKVHRCTLKRLGKHEKPQHTQHFSLHTHTASECTQKCRSGSNIPHVN